MPKRIKWNGNYLMWACLLMKASAHMVILMGRRPISMATLNTPSIVGSLFILPLPSRGLVMWIFLENHLSMIFPSLLWKRVMILKTSCRNDFSPLWKYTRRVSTFLPFRLLGIPPSSCLRGLFLPGVCMAFCEGPGIAIWVPGPYDFY